MSLPDGLPTPLWRRRWVISLRFYPTPYIPRPKGRGTFSTATNTTLWRWWLMQSIILMPFYHFISPVATFAPSSSESAPDSFGYACFMASINCPLFLTFFRFCSNVSK